MAGTIQAGTLISSNSRSIDVDDIGVRSYAGGGGAFNYRNKIVDGRFDFWYEGTSQTSSGYGSDTAWRNENIGSTKVHSRGTLTPGVDLPCIEVPTARYFSRTVVSSVAGAGNRCRKYQAIESIYTLAGKQVTVSFYAKSNAARNMSVCIEQNPDIAGGGSPLVNTVVMKKTLSTSWTKYVATVTLPSIAGLTINQNQANFFVLAFWFDAGSDYNVSTSSLGQQSGTFDIACVQVEEGSVATPFEELPLNIVSDKINTLYYFNSVTGHYAGVAGGVPGYLGVTINLPQIMRVTPYITIKYGGVTGRILIVDSPTYIYDTGFICWADDRSVTVVSTSGTPKSVLKFDISSLIKEENIFNNSCTSSPEFAQSSIIIL